MSLVQSGMGGLWSDDARIDDVAYGYKTRNQHMAQEQLIDQGFLYFGCVAFKGQKQPTDTAYSARFLTEVVDVVTTSGDQTGVAPSVDKVRLIKTAIRDFPLAVASGMTPENVSRYLPYVDCFLVNTSLCVPGTERFDPERVKAFSEQLNQ